MGRDDRVGMASYQLFGNGVFADFELLDTSLYVKLILKKMIVVIKREEERVVLEIILRERPFPGPGNF